MSQHIYNGLIEEFCLSIGLRDARPDNDGYCALSFDAIVVHLQYTKDDDTLTLFARLGTAEGEQVPAIFTMLLAANLFWKASKGCTFSAEPESNTIFIATRNPLGALNAASFREWIGDFVDTTEEWVANLKNANEGQHIARADDEDLSNALDVNFMTRV